MFAQRYIAILASLIALLCAAGTTYAQQNSPTIGFVYPAGGRQGSTFEVTVGGQFLRDAEDAVISGKGVQVEVVEHMGPIPQKQVEELREQLKELRQRRQAAGFGMERPRPNPQGATNRPTWTDDDEKEMTRIMERLETFARTRVIPALSDIVTLKVKIAPDAPLGTHSLRLEANGRLTNPMIFCVGRFPEFSEPVAKGAERFGIADDPAARRMFPRRNADPEKQVADVALPIVVNGQITAGGRHRYRFPLRKGQRIVAVVQARQLVPYLADAVPGWFQALVSVTDPQGNEVACGDHYRFDPDPTISWIAQSDGQYSLEITDALFRGREDFVYRITLGQLPLVTSIFPLGAQAGSLTNVTLSGWNLPKTHVLMNGKDKPAGTYPLWDSKEPFINTPSFVLDDLLECLEHEPNHDIATAQPVTLPVIINGHIEQPGTWDIFRFDGKAGQTIVAEVLARRLGSPLDSAIKITDASGKQLAFNDDAPDKAAGLLTHHADSCLTLKLPADGAYYVYVCDMQRKAGPEYAYRLRLSAPRPDFDLRVTPSTINFRAGQTMPLTAYVIRRDGFNGEIKLSLKDTPDGLKLTGATIPAGQEQAKMTLSASRETPAGLIALHIEGHAKIADMEIVRQAVPADDLQQAFAYHHLVPADELLLCVADRPFPREAAKILSPTPLNIPAGGKGVLLVALPAGPFLRNAQVELNDPPEGLRVLTTEATDNGVRITIGTDATKAKPGLQGNLVFNVYTERSRPDANKAVTRRVPLGSLPAVPFTIVDGR